jgi:DNA-directed RNA polymerase specialized sigma24 family protein
VEKRSRRGEGISCGRRGVWTGAAACKSRASGERPFDSSPTDLRDQAWEEFLREFSGLIRHVARKLGGDDDVVLDRYALVLGALRENDFRRLRQFRARGSGKFSTWLVAVTRRLCVDEHRRRYGRPQGGNTAEWREARRNLVELVSAQLSVDDVASPGESVDAALERREALEALSAARRHSRCTGSWNGYPRRTPIRAESNQRRVDRRVIVGKSGARIRAILSGCASTRMLRQWK